jgi:amino acid transporter
MDTTGPRPAATATKIVVATTVALSFISFWRAAAIVLSDLASSAFYAGGITEQAVGKSAPWLVLGVMLFSFAVRNVYLESSTMFVRGGVYVVVRQSMGPTLAKLSVSALVFDYILTGPISAVSAGQYLGGLLNEMAELLHSDFRFPVNLTSSLFAILVTIYFWRKNVIGIHESSGKALRIMQINTVMLVLLLIWCPLSILLQGKFRWPPLPSLESLSFGKDALGWLEGTTLPSIGAIAVIVALGHAILSMSGYETLAQVNREIAHPKVKNLLRAGRVIGIYSFVFASAIPFFGYMLIADDRRPQYLNNLIGGIATNLSGPHALTLAFHAFVVVVGMLILSGAVNTSFIGSNGILNRVAEDGVLTDWFRTPHPKYGTTHYLINIVLLCQLITIVASRGNLYLLGEAYAFGVVWSFFMKALGTLVLRFQRREDREWKFPFNFHLGKIEIPLGLGLTTFVLFVMAMSNLLTKKIATISGALFTLAFFVMFTVSERINRRRATQCEKGLEMFRLDQQSEVTSACVNSRPGCVVVAVRGSTLSHLERALQKTNTRKHDIVVLSIRPLNPAATGESDLETGQIFAQYETELFTRVVTLAEKAGKHVELLVVPAVNPFDAMVQAAAKLEASKLVTGRSAKMTADELATYIGDAWERLPAPRPSFSLEVTFPGEESRYYNLGPHPPRLWPEDLDLLHQMWLQLTHHGFGARLHHRDVVGVALRRLQRDLDGENSEEVRKEIERETQRN